MPVKRENISKYPKDWKSIVEKVKKRSGGRCECEGECGLHTTTGRCIEINDRQARYARGKVILTTAHLCHDESCRDMSHLKHMCQRCHLRYDVQHHKQTARATRMNKKAVGMLFEE